VIDMKKRMLVIACIGLLLGIGTFLLINQLNTNNTEDNTATQQKDAEQDDKRQEKQKNEKKDNEKGENKGDELDKDSPPQRLNERVVEAVQGTVDIFTKEETRIVAVGDSLTQGVGDSTGNGGYVGILNNTINQINHLVEFGNYGHRGDRTDQLLKRLDDPNVSTAIADADIVLMTIGANDIMQVVKENFTNLNMKEFKEERVHYEARLREIFAKIRKMNPETEIYLVGFYNPYDKYFKDIEELAMIVDEWNSAGKAITEELDHVNYIPTKDLFDDTDEDLFAEDNFHPNDLGYQRMAKRVLEYLTKQER